MRLRSQRQQERERMAGSFSGDAVYQFERDFPTEETTQQARNDADYQRALTAYRFWYPTVSIEGFFHGAREAGAHDNERLFVLSAGPRFVCFTPNSDTPYCGGVIDLSDGPVVVELPPGPFIAAADNHHQGWILDMGLPGPDAGNGGRHLLLPPGYDGAVPEGYNVGRSSTYKVFLGMRCLPLDGDMGKAMDGVRSIKVYPLATPSKPLAFVDVTERRVDVTHLAWEDNFAYWEKLHDVINAEPVQDEFRPMYGLLAELGIAKGKPFAPDKRMKAILERAARSGCVQMLVSSFDSHRPDRIAWDGRRWEWASLVYDNGDFETPGGIDLEARDRWYAQAILGSPAMFRRKVGFGSLYWLGVRDNNGDWLDGGETYRLTVPLPVPARLFWSVTVYDARTRSQIQTDQDKAALRSLFELAHIDQHAAVDLYFGPTPPNGHEERWIKTIPDQGWFTYFRIYGPEEPAFDGSWKPDDFDKV
jgi:hypothetical protein